VSVVEILILVALALVMLAVVALSRLSAAEQRTMELAAGIPDTVVRQVLDAIDRRGRASGAQVALLRHIDPDPHSTLLSHVGGEPSIPRQRLEQRAGIKLGRFVAQIELLSPPLPPQWAGKVVFVFESAEFGEEPDALVLEAAEVTRLATRLAPGEPGHRSGLSAPW
jgi:hypothetical protein